MNSSYGLAISDDPCRNSRGDRAGGQIFRDDGSSTDDVQGTRQDHACQSDGIGSENRIVERGEGERRIQRRAGV